MRLNCLTPPLCIIVLLIKMESTQPLPDVVMNVTYEGSPNFMINVAFASYVFQQLYQCLCDGATWSCQAQYTYPNQQSNGYYQASTINAVQRNENVQPCNLYKCTNSRQYSSVICTSLNSQDNTCTGMVNPSFITLTTTTNCDAKCVGISWTVQQEALIINNRNLMIQFCDNECCQSTLNPFTGSSESTSLNPVTGCNESAGNDSVFCKDEYGKKYTETIVVCAVAAGIIIIALTVLVISLLIMRKKSSDSLRRGNNHELGVSRDNTGRSIAVSNYRNHVIQNGSDPQNQTINDTQFGNSNATFSTGQKNRDAITETSGNQATDDYKNRTGLKKLFFGNRKSKTNKDNNPLSVTYRKSSIIDGEYATLDELQMQPDDRFYQNNSPNSQSFTDAISLNAIDNEGYTSAEISGFCNNNRISDSSSLAAESNNPYLEPTNTKNEDLSSHKNLEPAYFVATQIPNEEFVDLTNVSVELGRSDLPASNSVIEDESTTDGSHDFIESLAQKRVKDSQTESSGEQKRATYFELEKEDEDV